MDEKQGTLRGERNLELIYWRWSPEGPPRALAILVHGYGEHMGRYRHVIEALTAQGYLVYGLDHRGHGRSDGPRANVEDFDYFVSDLHQLVSLARGENPDLPMYMIGHSMGGLIATHYALRHESLLEGLVLSGAALQVGDDVSPLLKRLSAFIARWLPAMAILENDGLLSRDPAVAERFDADPLTYKGRVKARMGYEMLTASEAAQARMASLSLPMLIMHGGADNMTSPQGSRRLNEVAASRDKTLVIWEGAYHEIFNEPNQDEVIQRMLDWLDQQMAGSPAADSEG